MTSGTRALPRLLSLLLGAALAVTLAGCGASSDDTFEELKGGTTPTAAPSTGKPSSPQASDGDGVGPGKVLKIKKYGVSFEVPKSWMSLDAGEALKNVGKGNKDIEEFADRLGSDTDSFLKMLRNNIQTMSVSTDGAEKGFVANINSMVIPVADPTAEELKLGLAAVGGKFIDQDSPDNEYGDVIRIRYTLQTGSGKIQGTFVGFDAGEVFVQITVSSLSRTESDELSDLVARTVRTYGAAGAEAS